MIVGNECGQEKKPPALNKTQLDRNWMQRKSGIASFTDSLPLAYSLWNYLSWKKLKCILNEHILLVIYKYYHKWGQRS